MIEFQHIHHSFGDRTVLEDVSLALESGDVILLSGENGSGKSTLLRIMAGLLKPNAGALVNDKGIRPLSRSRRSLLDQVMYMHQTPYLFEGSVRKNLGYALRRGEPNADSRITQALEWVGLGRLVDEEASTLSGGERQRLALARALLRRPRILLLDEPTAHMDTTAVAQISDLLIELRAYTEVMLMTSHEPGFMRRLEGVEYLLEQGKLSKPRGRFRQPSAEAEA